MNTPIRSFVEFQNEVRSLRLLLLRRKFDRFAHQLRLLRKYNADQPRIPAGQTGGGQWTDGAGAGDGSPLGAITDAVSTILGTVESALSFVLAGGFTKDQMNMTVQDFTSQFCQGSVNRELPSQFSSNTIEEIQNLAKQGSDAAAKCIKLLKQDRFRK
jgi:hypothetical protein